MRPQESGNTLALHLPPAKQGYQVNILGTSLVSRLKQGSPQRQPTKPQREVTAASRSRKKSKISLDFDMERQGVQKFQDGGESRTSSSSPSSQHGRGSRLRIASATTTTVSGEPAPTSLLPRLPSSVRSTSGSRVASRRSLSAGPAVSAPAARPINVVKRDGVFQPADKYMPARLAIRDCGGAGATLCDYLTYVLADDTNLASDYPRIYVDPDSESQSSGSPRQEFGSGGKKRAKVSWKATTVQAQVRADWPDACTESRQDFLPTPSAGSTPAFLGSAKQQRRAQSVDTMAFRRPVYTSSGTSRVSSIGLRWQIPAGSTGSVYDDTDNTQEENSQGNYLMGSADSRQPRVDVKTAAGDRSGKPMWSYLITREPQSRPPAPPPKPRKKRAEQQGAAKRHNRDVHPVATALQRAGSSIASNSKWSVPSISSKTSGQRLEAERALRERLLLIKKPGQVLLQILDPRERGRFESAAQRFRRAMEEAGRADEINDDNGGEDAADDNEDGGHDGADDAGEAESQTPRADYELGREEGAGDSHRLGNQSVGEREERLTARTTSATIEDDKATSADDDDRLTSPTKSRSTFCP